MPTSGNRVECCLKYSHSQIEANSQMQPPIDSRQLIAFVTLARTGSYSKTARELFLSHSAISHSMRALEEEMGCRLLHRVDKKVALTEAGEALLHHAQRALQKLQDARVAVESINKWGYQRLRLGVGPLMALTFLPRVLAELRQANRRLLVELLNWDSEDPVSFIENHQADLLIGEKNHVPSEIEFISLFESPYQLIVPPAHPWALLGHVLRGDLPKEPCLLGRKESPGRNLVEDYFAAENLTLNVVAEAECPATIKGMIQAGYGVAVLPRWTVAEELGDATLVALGLGKRVLSQSWGVLHRHGKRMKPIEVGFTELLIAHGTKFMDHHRTLKDDSPRS